MVWLPVVTTNDCQGGQVLTTLHYSLDRIKRKEAFGHVKLCSQATDRVPRQIKYIIFEGRRKRTVKEWPQIIRTELPPPRPQGPLKATKSIKSSNKVLSPKDLLCLCGNLLKLIIVCSLPPFFPSGSRQFLLIPVPIIAF